MDSLKEQVFSASNRPEVRSAISELYADLQLKIDERKPICSASGRCCHFDQFGHRLYVTTMELAAFLYEIRNRKAETRIDDGAEVMNVETDGCRFQAGRLCSVHTIRPFGCRIFFCDATAQQWQQETYELFHARLRRLHEELNVPYYYVEWREALVVSL